MPGTMIDYAEMIVAEYDTIVRQNRCPTDDTLAAVAADDGFYVWYEVQEVLQEHNCPFLSESTTEPEDDEFYRVLGAVIAGYQLGLRGQVAAEAAHRAWREQT